MKLKSILTISIVAAAIAGLYSCQEKEEAAKDTQSFDSEELTVNKPASAAEDYKINIKASETVSWTAALDDNYEWIELNGGIGKGNGEILYSLKENENLDSRIARIVVDAISEINDFKYRKNITIVQIGTAPALLVSPVGEMDLPADENNTFIIDVISNLSWTASVNIISGEGQWLSVTSGNAGQGSGQVVLSISENDSQDYRSAEVTIFDAAYPELGQTLIVRQQYTGMNYRIEFAGMTGYVPSGEYTMSLEGSASQIDDMAVTVTEEEGKTVIEYTKALKPGEYEIKTLASDDRTYELNAPFVIGENSVVTEIAPWDGSMNMFGGTEKWPFRMDSYEDLVVLKDAVAAGNNFSGMCFSQTSDITMAADAWPGIGSADMPFSGIYDGNEFIINDLCVESAEATGHAFFNYVQGAEHANAIIKNMVIRGTVESKGYTTAVVGFVKSFSQIVNCINHATINAVADRRTAGIVSNAEGKGILIADCKNYGTINANNGNADCAGVVAYAKGSSKADVVIIMNCRNYGTCTFSGNSGGILGSSGGNVKMSRCANYGSITNTKSGQRVGCIVGSTTGYAEISECFNAGAFSGTANNGAIAGFAEKTVVITNCYNRGDLKFEDKKNNTGGILGHMKGAENSISNCYCAGTMAGSTAACGIVGSNTAGSVSANNLKASYYLAGIGYKRGSNQAGDAAGVVEVKEVAFFTSGTPFDGWDTEIWEFKSGSYPTLKNNPED